MAQIIAGGTEPNPGGNTQVIQQVQTANWTQMSGKPFITVAAKGIENGLSSILNDGADFGPDTKLGATTTGQYGSSGNYTETAGIQEPVNYLKQFGGGTIHFHKGIYSIPNAGSPSSDTALIEFPSSGYYSYSLESEAPISEQITINSTGDYGTALILFQNSGPTSSTYRYFAFGPAGLTENSNLWLSFKNMGIASRVNVGQIYNAHGMGTTIEGVSASSGNEGYGANANNSNIVVDGDITNLSWINNVVVWGGYNGFTIQDDWFFAGNIDATYCYNGLNLQYGTGSTHLPLGATIGRYSAGYCANGITISETGTPTHQAQLTIQFYSMYNSNPVSTKYYFDYDINDPNNLGSIKIYRFLNSINGSGGEQVNNPSINGGSGTFIDNIMKLYGQVYGKVVGGILTPQGFAVTTPAVPSTGTGYTNSFLFPVRIYFLTATSVTYTITDAGGNTGSSITGSVGTEVTLDPGATITPTYTTLTWEFYGI